MAHKGGLWRQNGVFLCPQDGHADNAAYRSLNHTDTLSASRALTHLEGLGLLERSEQRRGPGVYYTLVREEPKAPQTTPHPTFP